MHRFYFIYLQLIKSSLMSHRLTVLPHLIKHTPKTPALTSGISEVYAFDLDHTLIEPISGSTFSRTAQDWQFVKYGSNTTIETIFQLSQDKPTALIVIFSNQGAVLASRSDSKSCAKYIAKIDSMLEYISLMVNGNTLLDKLWIYSSTKVPAKTTDISPFKNMRKPATGMMEQFKQDIGQAPIKLKYYCGDAAGRSTDFSDSDLKLAHNLRTDFKLPEDIFIT